MFKNIMIPVDLENVKNLEYCFQVAANIARMGNATLHLIHVGGTAPEVAGRTPKEQAERLDALGRDIAFQQKVQTETLNMTSNDTAIELNKKLMEAIKLTNADLVIVASHIPRFGDAFVFSHGGYIAEHADVSVFVIREAKPKG